MIHQRKHIDTQSQDVARCTEIGEGSSLRGNSVAYRETHASHSVKHTQAATDSGRSKAYDSCMSRVSYFSMEPGLEHPLHIAFPKFVPSGAESTWE